MKLKHILIITLFSFLKIKAQINNGNIQYKSIANIEIINLAHPEIRNDVTKDFKEAEKISYSLTFTPNESIFYANPTLLEGRSYENATKTLGGNLKYYQNKSTQEYRELYDDASFGKIIINQKKGYQWTLTNESKNIEGFKCYKATSPVFTDGVINTNVKFGIIAWYCPEIPIGLGPCGYGDLPGLILELQLPPGSFVATKIELNATVPPEIDKLDFKKAISPNEYVKMMKENLSKEKLQAIEK